GFLPVAADFGPDGALWVLERRFLRHGAFGSRLRRARRADLASWATILQTPDGVHGNLEGLSLWRDGAGRTRAAMVADDNFRWLQRNEFVEYVLDV
ncbi:MAG: esterase-like activity of phytase family protein, partial [Gemmobacter sp.]